ncbi:MAG: hypothetical protein AAGL34_01670 [Bacteroidota bacterium]
MVIPQISKAPKVLFFIGFIFLFVLSCGQDSDLYDELSAYEEVNKEIEDKDLNSEDEETDEDENTNEDENSDEETNDTAQDTNHPVEGAYYVTANGSASNDGLSEESSWSLQQALSRAGEGDVVYVKAGEYFINRGITTDISGTMNNPVRIIGYKDNPGDIQSSNGSTFKYGDEINASDMPMIVGSSYGSGWGITWNGREGVEIENFIITKFDVAMTWGISHGKIKNVIAWGLGLQDRQQSGSGNGFRITGSNNTIENCYAENIGSVAISLFGGNNTLRHTEVVGSNNNNTTGYFILCSGERSTRNEIEYCTISRYTPDNDHQGHGFITKDGATYNTFRNSTAHNTGIEASYKNSHHNVWENISITCDADRYRSVFSAGIRLMNGTNNNVFRNIYVENNISGIEFRDYDDGSSSDLQRDAQEGGSDNLFVNIIVNNVERGIWFSDGEGGSNTSFSNDNTFVNCTFHNVDRFISAAQNIDNMNIVNCIVDGVGKQMIGTSNGSFDLSIQNTNFSGTNLAIPQGRNLTAMEPNFRNPSNRDFRLQGSNLEVGIAPPVDLARTDFNGKTRSAPYNLGAFE